MKFDAADPLLQRIISDDRPIALRKRRRSVVHKANTVESPQKSPPKKTRRRTTATRTPAKTPAKAKKKVRFSDPGPEISASTGLTPALRSSSLGGPFGILPGGAPPTPFNDRRLSLPPVPTDWHINENNEVQFPFIVQALTPRIKRQIARRNVSETVNQVNADRKTIEIQQAEIRSLREALQVLERSESAADNAFIEDSELTLPDLDHEMPSVPDSMDVSQNDIISPFDTQNSHEGLGVFIEHNHDETLDLQAQSQPVLQHGPTPTHQGVQTERSTTALEEHIATQTAQLTRARLELERVFPGETILPLTPEDGDCAPLLNALLNHLQTTQTTLRTTRTSMANAETQRINIRDQFHATLAQLETARLSYAELLKGARAGAEKFATARARIADLEKEVDESSRSRKKLRTALDKYREEVHAMENLITRLEQENQERIDKVQAEANQTVADLECTVAAETRGRREAEAMLDTKTTEIKGLQGSQKELKAAISEKQAIVRSLEEELDQVKAGKEQEVGVLMVRISWLEEELSAAQAEIKKLQLQKDNMLDKFKELQSKKVENIAQLKDALEQAVQSADGFIINIEKDIAEQSSSFRFAGLVTPTTDTGRFRDATSETIDGAVEVNRGKARKSRKNDSIVSMMKEDLVEEDTVAEALLGEMNDI